MIIKIKRCVFVSLILFLGLLLTGETLGENKRYDPTWEFISQHIVPEWYEDAKLGIFIHWGLYSLPGWAQPIGELGKVDWDEWFIKNPYSEWHLNTMKIKDSPTWKYHVKTYGENFSYLDFVPIFNEEVKKWRPDEWAKLFKEVGARYLVLTTKHHDGFTLWSSRVKNPYRKINQQGAEHDLVGDLTQAVRKIGLKMGLYYSGGLDWSFNESPITKVDDVFSTTHHNDEFVKYVEAHWQELIERYHPDILWNDISYPKNGDVKGLFAKYYNQIPEGVINDRWSGEFSDVTTPEYQTQDKITAKKWETCRGIGFSFGYNRIEGPEHMLSVNKLVDMFVDIVSKNGNLLLDIGPEADGTISTLQLERLQGLGRWLKVNGEGIFGSRPWVRADGKTKEGIDLRFTKKGESVYAILMDKPRESYITIPELIVDEKTIIELLGVNKSLSWTQNGRDIKVNLVASLPESEAYTLKITPKPWKLLRE